MSCQWTLFVDVPGTDPLLARANCLQDDGALLKGATLVYRFAPSAKIPRALNPRHSTPEDRAAYVRDRFGPDARIADWLCDFE